MKIERVNGENYIEKIDFILNRSDDSFDQVDDVVSRIIGDVRKDGDGALLRYTKEFDGVDLNSVRVTEEEIEEALAQVDDRFLGILQRAKANITDFHEKQLEQSWISGKGTDILLGQKVSAIARVGVYVPGGTAAYPSTVLMDVLPAKVAGVKSIAMVTPPLKNGKVNPNILAAASICGVDEIFKVGGAQAIAALAYGTNSIRPVNKIVGPGNIFVARAKKSVFGKVDIDMIAGPSEVLVIADSTANPRYVAADLLAQAEHDKLACSILVTDSEEMAAAVSAQVDEQLKRLSRTEITRASIERFGTAFVTETMDMAFTVANEIAPEHLELMIENPLESLYRVENAGAIFLGKYSPEPLGDYYAGPNHTLPTSGTAKYSSALGVDAYIKRSSIIFYGENALRQVKDDVMEFANKEGLDAHANAIGVRYEEEY